MIYFEKIQLKLIKQLLKTTIFRGFSHYPLSVIGVPFGKGQSKLGVEKGPSALRNYGLIERLKEIDIDVKDYGNLEFINVDKEENAVKLKNPTIVAEVCKKISHSVKEIVGRNERCLALGGDHSIAIGTIHGHSLVHKDICVLWIDAHTDINTESTTYSGHLHGMSCSFLIKELAKYSEGLPLFDWLKPCINKTNIAYIGVRDIDPLEKLILTKENILHFSTRDIDRLGIVEVVNRALEAVNPKGNLPLHVSFDIDSIDKVLAPSTGTPVLGGLTLREVLYIAEEISKTNTLSAMDLVEVNPLLGSEEQVHNTLSCAILVAKAFFGYSRSGNLPKHISEIPV